MKPGDHLGSFELLRPLGEGPFGVVWLASDVNGTPAAVKLLKPAFVKRHAGQAAFNRLLASIRTHQQLRHEGLVAVYGPVEDAEQGALGMVTEYVEGRQMSRVRLPERARHGQDPRALATLLRWFEELADAVAWLHAQDVVHGNLKPTNIMLVRRADAHQLKILDLPWSAIGLASPPPGQVTYLAPEQVQGGAPTTASDQWSLAMLLYRILTSGNEQAGLAGFPTSLVVALQRASRTLPRERFGEVAQLGAAVRATRMEVEAQIPGGAHGATPLPMVGTPLPVVAPAPTPEALPPPTFAPQPPAQAYPGYPGYPQAMAYPQGYPGYPQPGYPQAAYPQPGYPMPGYPYPAPGYPQMYPGYPTGYPQPSNPMGQPAPVPTSGPGLQPLAPVAPAAPTVPTARPTQGRGESIPPVPTARRMVRDADTDGGATPGDDSMETPMIRHRVESVVHADLSADRLEAAVPEDPSLGLEHAGVAPLAEPELGETPEVSGEVGSARSEVPVPAPAGRRWLVPLVLALMFALGAAAALATGLVRLPGAGGPSGPTPRSTRPPNPSLDQPVPQEPVVPEGAPPAALELDPAPAPGEAAPGAATEVAPGAKPRRARPARDRRGPKPAADDAIDEALKRLGAGDPEAREQQVACDEGAGAACVLVGRRAQQRGDQAAARAAFARACEFGQAEGCFRAGRLAVVASPREALLLYTTACDGMHPEACEASAELLARAGRAEEAAARRKKACELGRKSACAAAAPPFAGEPPPVATSTKP
jgi:serine/threonine protein kinase